MILHQGPDHLVFIHDELDIAWHEHHFLQIGLGLFDLEVGAQTYKNLTGFVINSNVKHKLKVKQKKCATVLVDNTADFGRFLSSQVLNNEDVLPIDLELQTRNYDWLLSNLTRYFQYQPRPVELDDRIRRIVSSISQQPTSSLADICKKVGLSTSRASHLFKQQMAMPFRSFQRQLKIMTAIRLFRQSNNLTDIAHQAGFTDSAHFTNTMKQYFGSAPGIATKELSYQYHPHTLSQLVSESDSADSAC